MEILFLYYKEQRSTLVQPIINNFYRLFCGNGFLQLRQSFWRLKNLILAEKTYYNIPLKKKIDNPKVFNEKQYRDKANKELLRHQYFSQLVLELESIFFFKKKRMMLIRSWKNYCT